MSISLYSMCNAARVAPKGSRPSDGSGRVGEQRANTVIVWPVATQVPVSIADVDGIEHTWTRILQAC